MMPTRIDRYLFRQLLVALIAVTIGLTALVWLVSSLRYVEVVVSHGQSMMAFLKLTAMKIPEFIAVILPIAGFAVTLRIYLRLSDDRELTVMRAAGMSQFALARPALGVAGFTVVLGYVLSLWVVPLSATLFREYLFQIRNQLDAFVLQEGVFNQLTPQMMVYARAREPDGTLRGIMVDDSRDRQHPYTVFAETGRLVMTASGPRVVLQAGTRQEIDRQTGRLNVLSFSENILDLALPKGDIEQRVRDTGELGLRELLAPGPALAGRQDFPRLRGEAFKRMTSPLNTVGYVLVALISVLSGRFQRHGGLMRPLAAVAAVVGLVAIGLGTDSLIARRPEFVGLLWLRAMLPAALAAAYLFWPVATGPVLRRGATIAG